MSKQWIPQKPPPKSNKGLVVMNKASRLVGRTYHHNPHTQEGEVLVFYEKTKGMRNWDSQGVLIHRSNLKFLDFIT